MPLFFGRRHGRQCRLCHPIVKVGRTRTSIWTMRQQRANSITAKFFCCRSLTDCSLSISVSLFLFPSISGTLSLKCCCHQRPPANLTLMCAFLFPQSFGCTNTSIPSIHPSRYITPFCVLVNSLPRLFSLYQLQGCSCRLNDCEME